jgi:hypothetical protein
MAIGGNRNSSRGIVLFSSCLKQQINIEEEPRNSKRIEPVQTAAEQQKEKYIKEEGMAVAIDVESYEEEFVETKEEKKRR